MNGDNGAVVASTRPPASSSGHVEKAGLYVHIPFCSAICPYCDFAVRRGDAAAGRALVENLARELEGLVNGTMLPEAADLASAVAALSAREFDTVYLGGGTPSLLDAQDLSSLLSSIRRFLKLSSETRFFLEANPEHVNATSAEDWHSLGIETLSLGVQALDDDALRFLGRGHDTRGALDAIAHGRRAGFETVSVDLIYGLPGQQEDSWRRQLDRVLEQPIDHLSLYELEIHERTSFGKRLARGELDPMAEDERATLFLATHERLEKAGWDGYEVSNFARTPSHRSRHNEKYWRHVPYLGVGPSAHSFAVDLDFGMWRFWNEALEPRWRREIEASRSPAAGWERLPPSAIALEMAMLGLRTRQGLDLEQAKRLSGIDVLAQNSELLDSWSRQGWLTHERGHLLPTTEGMARADRLAAELELVSETAAQL